MISETTTSNSLRIHHFNQQLRNHHLNHQHLLNHQYLKQNLNNQLNIGFLIFFIDSRRLIRLLTTHYCICNSVYTFENYIENY